MVWKLSAVPSVFQADELQLMIQEARNMKPDGTAKEPKVREPKGKGKGKKSKRQ